MLATVVLVKQQSNPSKKIIEIATIRIKDSRNCLMEKCMKKIIVTLGLLGLVLAGCGTTKAASTTTISTASTPLRIVSTAVATTDLFAKLDLDLVGVPKTSYTLPSRYQQATKVGSAMSPDVEIMSALKPDMVYSTTTLEADLAENFKKAGLKTDFLDFTSIESMMKEIKTLGKRYDRTKQATSLNATLQAAIDQAKANAKGKKAVKVLVLMGIPGSYLVATENSYIGNLVKLAGGTNVVQGESAEYLASNTEYLQQSNPDVILRAAHGYPDEVIKMFDKEFKENDIWQHFSAVQNDRVYDLNDELFGMTATVDAPKSLKKMETLIYGNQ
jgi:iron complex transport system substrate-binding protein